MPLHKRLGQGVTLGLSFWVLRLAARPACFSTAPLLVASSVLPFPGKAQAPPSETPKVEMDAAETAECPGTQASPHRVLTVGVVGAGMSGAVLASRLHKSLGAKAVVTVLEWGRGPGGRTARRRVKLENGEEGSFDHAAPFFSATSDVFQQELLQPWQAKGLVEQWKPRLASANDSQLWVGTPSNHAVCRSLIDDLGESGGKVLFGRHARDAKFVDGQWHLTTANRLDGDKEEVHRFDALVLSDKLLVLPNRYAVLSPEDASTLSVPATLDSAGQVAMLLAFDPPLDVELDLIRLSGGPLDMLVRDSSKPGRHSKADLWTARSTASYAAQHLQGEALDDEPAVLAELLAGFKAAVGTEQQPSFSSVFAWDHAQPTEQLAGRPFALDEARRLGLCGDFFQPGASSGVEAAALSGLFLSKALLPLLSAL